MFENFTTLWFYEHFFLFLVSTKQQIDIQYPKQWVSIVN